MRPLRRAIDVVGRLVGRQIGRASVFRLMRDPALLLDARDRIADVNPAFERRLGPLVASDTGAAGVIGRPVGDALPDLATALQDGDGPHAADLEGALDGWAMTVDTLVGRRGRQVGRTVILRDVRVERAREKRLRYQADRDPLTGALNRRAFDALLAQALAEMDARVTLAYLDLDGFKDINDFYGHATGDAVLIETAARLGRVLRDGDALGRMGGDEFAVALVGLDRDSAAPIVARLRRALEPLHDVHAATLPIEASLGLASAPEDGRDVHALMAAADEAMYRAKARRQASRTSAGDGDDERGGEGVRDEARSGAPRGADLGDVSDD